MTFTRNDDELRANLNNKNSLFQTLQTMSTEFIDISKLSYDFLPEDEREALQELAKNKSIIISKADKGNAVVIQNVLDYRDKVLEILASKGKFKKLDHNVTRTRETKLQNYLRRLNKEVGWIKDKRCKAGGQWKRLPFFLDKTTYEKILPCGSRAGVVYGLPKIHKPNLPIRPIISAWGTYNFKLARNLVEILTPLVDDEYMLKDTFDFVNKVSNLDPNVTSTW